MGAMTRLAIIFLVVLVTPIQAADKIISCGVEGAVFKYKDGISYDECHSRILGEWYLMTNWRAENGVCFKGAAHDYIDFIALKYEFETIDRIQEEPCAVITNPN